MGDQVSGILTSTDALDRITRVSSIEDPGCHCYQRNPSKNINELPHVVILGAGASAATCPCGDRHGRPLPVMNNLVEIVGLADLLSAEDIEWKSRDFEQVYDALAKSRQHVDLVR